MDGIFFQVTSVICLAAFLAIIFRILRQPLILAYILTGIIIGPLGIFAIHGKEVLQVMGEFGITLLLFMLGLELRLDSLKSIGKTALTVGVLQMFLTFVLGFSTATMLGFSQIHSFYIGIALIFSSTIIVAKLLSDKKDLNSLYGKIAIGILLIQDFVAILIMMFLSGFNAPALQDPSFISSAGLMLIKAVVLLIFVVSMNKHIFPHSLDSIAKSQETLFLFSLAWVFGMAALVSLPQIGFSIEAGGLLAGLALSNSKEAFQIVARVKALRDFFITIFFVFLGTGMVFNNIGQILIPTIIFTIVVLFGKSLIIALVMKFLGYRKRTSFLTGISLSQISEFSLIIIFLGQKLGHISQDIISIITLVGIITFILSSYNILHINSIHLFLRPYLGFLEKNVPHKEAISLRSSDNSLQDHVVLIGAHRMGQSILESLKNSDNKVIVIDFDPDIIENLKKNNIESFFGDISDLDIQEKANMHLAKLVISTVPDVEDNLVLIKALKHKKTEAKIIVMASNFEESESLYHAGADYVVLPHVAGGMHIANIIEKGNFENLRRFQLLGKL